MVCRYRPNRDTVNGQTPAQASKLTDHPWTVAGLIEASSKPEPSTIQPGRPFVGPRNALLCGTPALFFF